MTDTHSRALRLDERSRSEARQPKGWQPRLGAIGGLALSAPMIILILLFVLYPLAVLLMDALSGEAGVSRIVRVFTDPISQRALSTTIWNSLVVAVVTVALSMVIAWTLHATTKRWLKILMWVTVLVPFAMGTIIKNYSILLILVANGPINSILMSLNIVEKPLTLLYTPFAVIYGITYSLIPYATFTLFAVFSTVDLRLLTASSVLGASRWRTLLGVVLPQVKGGIIVAVALVFVLSIGFYVSPIVLGGLQTPFMAVQIRQQLFNMYDFPGASASAVVLLAFAALALLIAIATAGRRAFKGVMTR